MTGYGDLSTVSTGGTGTAAYANQLKDNFDWLALKDNTSGAPAGRIWRSTTQSAVADSADIVMSNSGYDYTRGGMVTGTPSTLIVPSGGAGIYAVTASARLSATYDGSGAGDFGIKLICRSGGGDNIIAATTHEHEYGSARVGLFNLAADYLAAVGDQFLLQVSWANMSNVDVIAAAQYSPIVTARWVGKT